jgi:hypothetical protein
MGGEEQAKPESLSDYGYTAFEKWDYQPFVYSVGCSTAPLDGTLDAQVRQVRQRSALSVPPRQAKVRILEATEIKSGPYAPLSHAFVEG